MMKNKKVIQMMVDVEKWLDIKRGNNPNDGMSILWFDGVCLATRGGNFIWMRTGVSPIKVTADRMREIK